MASSTQAYVDNPGTIQVKCPFCGAEPEKRCRPKHGFPGSRNNQPHAARIKAAKRSKETSQ